MSEARRETPLATKLKERIRRGGPISVREYMQVCLHDAEHGYYRKRTAIGAQGDFITAPEISQVFGELIGIWCAVAWRAMGAPAQVQFVELGPGRGTLTRDALRAARVVPGFLGAASLHLVESNAVLREMQREALWDLKLPMTWHQDAEWALTCEQGIPRAPTIVIANEFLDALPIEQSVYEGGAWQTRVVTLDANGELIFAAERNGSSGLQPPARFEPREGDILESCPGGVDLGAALGARALHGPLAALFIDYGPMRSGLGDTLQAVSTHRHVSPLAAPGETDLTAHVDFDAFARAAEKAGLAVDGPITQAEFLLKMGLVERTEKLMASALPDQIGLLEAGARRIADPMGMGGLFKVVCMRSKHVPLLPPFAPAG
jgi:NADH dehydrogenase [ubiquinone] 1 alpha subcomplex assembly factor 7